MCIRIHLVWGIFKWSYVHAEPDTVISILLGIVLKGKLPCNFTMGSMLEFMSLWC